MGNYDAWRVNPDDFPANGTLQEQLRFFVRFAVLAPSSHNSQPWRFSVRANDIVITPDLRRILPASDSDLRQLYVSIGCATHNIRAVGDCYGYTTSLNFVPDERDGTLAVAVSFSLLNMPEQGAKKDLLFSLMNRRTNRSPYTTKFPPEDFLQLLEKLSDNSHHFILVSDKAQRVETADVVSRALIAAMDNPMFRAELFRHVKSNVTASPVGMPLFGWGMPLIPSLVVPLLIRFFNVNRLTRTQDVRLLSDQTPLFVIIASRDDDPHAWIRTGILYENLTLEATRRGLATHPLAAAIQIGSFYHELRRAAGIDPSLRPQLFCRVGYPTRTDRHSPRLIADAVLQ